MNPIVKENISLRTSTETEGALSSRNNPCHYIASLPGISHIVSCILGIVSFLFSCFYRPSDRSQQPPMIHSKISQATEDSYALPHPITPISPGSNKALSLEHPPADLQALIAAQNSHSSGKRSFRLHSDAPRNISPISPKTPVKTGSAADSRNAPGEKLSPSNLFKLAGMVDKLTSSLQQEKSAKNDPVCKGSLGIVYPKLVQQEEIPKDTNNKFVNALSVNSLSIAMLLSFVAMQSLTMTNKVDKPTSSLQKKNDPVCKGSLGIVRPKLVQQEEIPKDTNNKFVNALSVISLSIATLVSFVAMRSLTMTSIDTSSENRSSLMPMNRNKTFTPITWNQCPVESPNRSMSLVPSFYELITDSANITASVLVTQNIEATTRALNHTDLKELAYVAQIILENIRNASLLYLGVQTENTSLPGPSRIGYAYGDCLPNRDLVIKLLVAGAVVSASYAGMYARNRFKQSKIFQLATSYHKTLQKAGTIFRNTAHSSLFLIIPGGIIYCIGGKAALHYTVNTALSLTKTAAYSTTRYLYNSFWQAPVFTFSYLFFIAVLLPLQVNKVLCDTEQKAIDAADDKNHAKN